MDNWYADCDNCHQEYAQITQFLDMTYQAMHTAQINSDHQTRQELSMVYDKLTKMLGKCIETNIAVDTIISGFEATN